MFSQKSFWCTAGLPAKKGPSGREQGRNDIRGTPGTEKQVFGLSELPWLSSMRG